MLPWRYRVVPRAVSFRAALLGWLAALLPILLVAGTLGEFDRGLRLVATEPAPLYVAAGVGALQAEWAESAMKVAWEAVPATLGLPLPDSAVTVVLLPDRSQFSQYLRRRFDLPAAPPNPPACGVDRSGPEPTILCDASSFGSRGTALAMIAHELTHHVLPHGPQGESVVPAWYEEGLAEYVGSLVLAHHIQGARYSGEERRWREWRSRNGVPSPDDAAAMWATRADTVAHELRSGWRLSLSQHWTSNPVDYARAALAVRWLVDCFGLPAVVGVARDSARSGSVANAFLDTFGQGRFEIEQTVDAALKAQLGAGAGN